MVESENIEICSLHEASATFLVWNVPSFTELKNWPLYSLNLSPVDYLGNTAATCLLVLGCRACQRSLTSCLEHIIYGLFDKAVGYRC